MADGNLACNEADVAAVMEMLREAKKTLGVEAHCGILWKYPGHADAS